MPEVEVYEYFILAAFGLVLGSLSVMLGVGGGVLTVPFLMWAFELESTEAIGTSTGIILFSSTVGAISFYRNGRLNVPVAACFSLFAIPGSLLGAFVGSNIDNKRIPQFVFAVFVMCLAVYSVIKAYRKHVANKKEAEEKSQTSVEMSTMPPEISKKAGAHEDSVLLLDIHDSPKLEKGSLLSGKSSLKWQKFALAEDSLLSSPRFPRPKVKPPLKERLVHMWGFLSTRQDLSVQDKSGKVIPFSVKLFPSSTFAFFGGFVGSFLGLGGGVVYVPLLTHVLKLPMEIASPLSTSCIMIANPFAAAMWAARDQIIWPFVFSMALGTVTGAIVVARVFHRIHSLVLQIMFWTAAGVGGIKMLMNALDD